MEILVSIFSKEDRSSREVRCPPEGRIAVGRGPECAVLVEGSAISREHLVLEMGEANTILVTDVSANGCWVNGSRIAKARRRPVLDTDVVEVPGFELRIRCVEAAAAQAVREIRAAELAPISSPNGSGTPGGATVALLNSFTRDEKFAAVAAFLSLGLVLVYALA